MNKCNSDCPNCEHADYCVQFSLSCNGECDKCNDITCHNHQDYVDEPAEWEKNEITDLDDKCNW